MPIEFTAYLGALLSATGAIISAAGWQSTGDTARANSLFFLGSQITMLGAMMTVISLSS